MDNDIPFYYNLSTGASTWKRPQGYDLQTDSKPPTEVAGYVAPPILASRHINHHDCLLGALAPWHIAITFEPARARGFHAFCRYGNGSAYVQPDGSIVQYFSARFQSALEAEVTPGSLARLDQETLQAMGPSER